MIAKRILRNKATSSFERLGQYILDAKDKTQGTMMTRTFDYILDQDGAAGRVGAVRFQNCEALELSHAIKEIVATQAMNTRATGDRTYHLVVSFAQGEKPTPEELEDIEDELCRGIGLSHHQRISAVHVDTAHLHLHIAINKIHPRSFRCIEPYYDKRRLMAACEALEVKHGLARTNHGLSDRKTPKGRAGDMESHSGEVSFLSWVKEAIGGSVEGEIDRAQDWESLHRFLRESGLVLRPRGAGLVIQQKNGTLTAKASSVSRKLSLKALHQRLGPYKAYEGPEMPAKQSYQKAPVQRIDTANLYADYQIEREAAVEARDRARDALDDEIEGIRERQARGIADLRRLVNQGGMTGQGKSAKNREYDFLADKYARDLKALKLQRQEELKTLYPVLSWQQYLQRRAERGDVTALSALREHKAREKRDNEAYLNAKSAEQSKAIVFRYLKPVAKRNGDLYYYLKDGGVVIDEGETVRIEKASPHATFLTLSLVMERGPGNTLEITGSEIIKKEAVSLAVKLRWNIRFADPDMEAERQHLMAEGLVKTSSSPAIDAFVAERNALSKRVPSIALHRAWSPADAGEAAYHGRRQLSDGSMAFLLKKGDVMLVKLASLLDSTRARLWQIGKTVHVDEFGRFVKRGRSG